MNYLLFYPDEIGESSEVLVANDRARYLKEFHLLKEGDEVPSLLLGTGRGRAKCVEITDEFFRFEADFKEEIPQFFPVTVVQALCRPQTMKKVLQYCAMLRVEDLIFIPSKTGEKSYRQSKVLENVAQQYELVKGLEQVGNPHPPKVRVLNKFSDLFEELRDESCSLVAEPEDDGEAGSNSLAHLIEHSEQAPASFNLAFGPELGWEEGELNAFHTSGFQRITLGEDHLRVEVALLSLLGQISLWRDLSPRSE